LKYVLLPFIILLSGLAGFGQYSSDGLLPAFPKPKKAFADTVWTIRGQTILDKRYKKWKVDFVLDGRQTLLSNTRVRLGGIRVGLEYRRVNRFGIGIYTLGDGVNVNSLAEVDSRINAATLNLAYASLFYERILFFHRKWEWSVTAHLGAGEITGKYRLPDESEDRTYSQLVRPLEGSTLLYFNLNYFISIGAGVGYRYIPSTPEELRSVYNAPVGILRLRIRLVKMVVGAFDKDIRTAP